ncbi:replication protein A 70 kDa DNA-binding subunit A-like [Vicia villosa]|uniref:replication protein A 70 kDa DNA-binding subunit A-like n=1 Tax=Vicia villosa TaxID=3911 RepID=UPI00273BEA30|nr:replication protein A 70 kDa DNA-binding subunit A-like [Vicia villosa]
MSRAPILIKDLVKGNQVWKMQIRVVDLWVVKEKSGHKHLELVIQDVKGDQIHVTTRSRDFKDWHDQVKEHETYTLYNGEPVVNDGALKVCSNPLKIVFNGGTAITNVPFPDIPHHKYNFQPIENFLKGSFKADLLYDVIGVLHEVIRTQRGGDGRKSCVNITLRDVEGNVIEVVLWDDYCKQFSSYNAPATQKKEPTIILLTHAWCKPNKVSGLPSLSNAWSGSRLHINLEHPQVEEFKARFAAIDSSNAPALSLTCDSSVQSANNNWKSLDEVRSIRAIAELKRDCFATTIGTTKHFKASKFGWFFEACPGCKSSNKSLGDKFECSCGLTNVEPVTKFKIEVEVVYDNHGGTFVFWDKDVIPYTKLNAKELKQVMKEAGEDNPKIWPAHLDVLLNKDLVFRVKYQSDFDQFSIVAILNGDNLYEKFDKYLTPDELNSIASVTEIPEDGHTEDPIEANVTQASEPTESAPMSIAGNNSGSPTASSSTTPAKRFAPSTSINDAILSEEITPKQSATKAKPIRKTKLIKKE